METVKPKFETGEDVMTHIGSTLCKNFTLSDPLQQEVYEKVYWCFAGEHASYPFSKAGATCASELGIDASKGILLVGNTGVGMTTLFRIMARYFFGTPRELKILSMGLLAEYLSNKTSGINQVLTDYGRRSTKDLLIDDLDLSLTHDYKTITIKDLIYQREEMYTKIQENYKTHLCFSFTADGNDPELSVKERLIEVYGKHIYSRMADICNVILWQGKSFRPV